jgi:hypothetical protein
MTPTIITKNGEFFMSIGASGGSVIPTATCLVSEERRKERGEKREEKRERRKERGEKRGREYG